MQLELFTDTGNLFVELCMKSNLAKGFKAVKVNKGSPGIDRVSINEFGNRLDEELIQLKEELESWAYKPQPVRRVEIPKPGKGKGVRLLGIPCVRDRVVQATLKHLLEPILDSEFSESSYGFRPGRDQTQAITASKRIVSSGKIHVVDIDLSKFFDRVHHDRLIHRLSLSIKDKRILRLIGLILRSGVMDRGLFKRTPEGTPQGGPLSPLLSNVVLDELDKELEKRGLEFCRFADDCNIYVRSSSASQRVMRSVSNFIENKLKLKVNKDKSKTSRSRYVRFLGMLVLYGSVAISKASMQRAYDRVKELTPRGSHLPMEQTIARINNWYRGWSNYYKMTNYPSQLADIEAHIRRRLRARIVRQQKRRRTLYRHLLRRGISKHVASKTVWSNQSWWALSKTWAMSRAYPNKWFIDRMGLLVLSDKGYPHWYRLRKYVRIV